MKRGFTVVELVVTITIMAILLTLGVVNMRSSQANSRDAERKADVETIAMHLETYYTSGTDDQAPSFEYPSTALVSNGSLYMTQVLRDINTDSLIAPGIDDPTLTFVPATNDTQDINNVTPKPTINQYVYQPINSQGGLCTTATADPLLIDALVVAGGGGGGGRHGGGGGGGGIVYAVNKTVSAGNYDVVVGDGGAGSISGYNQFPGYPGGNSTFSDLVAIGGGGGGADANIGPATSGGSGGGGGSSATGASALQPSSASGGFGFNGGNGLFNTYYMGGGGGGAGGAGGNAAYPNAGAGGAGKDYSISGTLTTYSAGGNGGIYNSTPPTLGVAGPDNTGKGGGGSGGEWNNGAPGGSGIVIIRYLSGTINATGGDITYSGGYTIHTFKTGGVFTITVDANALKCRKFNLYYRTEVDDIVHMITSKNQ